MAERTWYDRLIRPRLLEALSDTPVVLIHGPRQCGKTSLARDVGESAEAGYLTLDDDVLLAAAQADPIGSSRTFRIGQYWTRFSGRRRSSHP